MTFLVYYILLLLRTPSNGSWRPICLIRSSPQFDFLLVNYKVTVLLRRWTFDCNWHTISFYCIVLYYCIVVVVVCSSSSRSSSSSLFEQPNEHSILTGKCNTIKTINVDIENECQCHTRLNKQGPSDSHYIRLGALSTKFLPQ